MANVNGLIGYNKQQSANNILLAAWGWELINVSTGLGYGLPFTSDVNVEFEIFNDHVFLQNYNDRPITFDGTTWSYRHVARTPRSRYIKKYKNRLYLGYSRFVNPSGEVTDAQGNLLIFPNRVFYSDLWSGNELTWGIEWGIRGTLIRYADGGGHFRIHSGFTNEIPKYGFKEYNIKPGDPFFLTFSTSFPGTVGKYTVKSVSYDKRIELVESPILTSDSDGTATWWIGGNWFDVETDDGDFVTWLGENNDNLLIFKEFSLHRYNGSFLQKVKDAPGTTSGRSVLNIGSLTFYFHGSNTNTRKTGVYIYNGSSSNLISRGIQKFIDGISSSNFRSTVAWREGAKYRLFVGNLTNAIRDISITNAVLTFDTEGNQWSIDQIDDTVTVAAKYLQSNLEKYFIGTSDNEIIETASGNDHNGTAISWSIEKHDIYPAGSNVFNIFTRITVVSRNASGVQVQYRLKGNPEDDDDQWFSIGEIQHNHQELIIPFKHNQGKGIDLRFVERSTRVNTLQIQKVTVWHIPQAIRSFKR